MKRGRPPRAVTREGLLELVRPRLEAVAVELTSLLWERLEAQLDACLDAARSALESDPTPLVEIVARPAREAAEEPEGDEEPRPRSERRCRLCRQPGHRANRCPGARAAAEVEVDDQDEDDAPPPTAPAPSLSRRDRFAAIEESARKRSGDMPVPRASFDLGGRP